VFDMKNSNITSTFRFYEAGHHIHDIVAIDDTHYLLGADDGLLKTTKISSSNIIIKDRVSTLCVMFPIHSIWWVSEMIS
jgi:hypothetical protein